VLERQVPLWLLASGDRDRNTGPRRRQSVHRAGPHLDPDGHDAQPPRVPGRPRLPDLGDGRVFDAVLQTNRIDITLTSTTVPSMPTRHFARANDLRAEIIQARLWGGVHYRDSSVKGVTLGRRVARYVLSHAFQRLR
jgi:hypothetical protein